ncbi:hypothetical protein [Pedococcus sp. 2YAF34]|uniref:hypothetical protein n=1 Tax=Pedococcus sp. 2YAF34 TaxID=3233032 RepID=UPI003F98C846
MTLSTFDPNHFFNHRASCNSSELGTELILNRMREQCIKITCPEGCGYRIVNVARHVLNRPHAGSPYRCRAHHGIAVDAKGRGCSECARELRQAKPKPTDERIFA